MEETLAPDVDRAWAEQFIVVCRLRGVPGDAIANALAEANDHLRASGSTALDAFGPAEEYVTTLALPRHEVGAMEALSLTGSLAVGFLGLTLALRGVTALRQGTPVGVTLGLAVMTVLTVLVMGFIGVKGVAVRSGAFRRPWAFSLVGFVWVPAGVVTLSLMPRVVMSLPTWPVLIVGLVAIGLGSWLTARREDLDDPAVPPLERASAPVAGARPAGRVGLALLYPVAFVVLGALTWFLRA